MRISSYLVRIDFYSGADHFGSETYTIDAANWYRAEQAALELSGGSAYDNPRIPDLRRTAIARHTGT
jgi:hypothetical protein